MIQDFPLPFDEFDEDEEDYEFKNRRLNKYQRKELKAIEKFIFKRFDKVSLIDGNPYLYTCRLAHNEDEALDMIREAVEREQMTIICIAGNGWKELVVVEPNSYYCLMTIRYIKKNEPHEQIDYYKKKEMIGYV